MARRISEFVQRQPFIPGAESAHGNQAEAWGPAVDVGIYAYNPSTSSELMIDGHMHRVESAPVIYLPTGSVVGNRDRITARGESFFVDGDPADFRNPMNASMDGLAVKLKAVDG